MPVHIKINHQFTNKLSAKINTFLIYTLQTEIFPSSRVMYQTKSKYFALKWNIYLHVKKIPTHGAVCPSSNLNHLEASAVYFPTHRLFICLPYLVKTIKKANVCFRCVLGSSFGDVFHLCFSSTTCVYTVRPHTHTILSTSRTPWLLPLYWLSANLT